MKVKIKDGLNQFKMIMTIAKNMGNETNLIFNNDGLTLYVNNQNVSILKGVFAPEFFEEYDITEDVKYGVFVSNIFNPAKKMTGEITIQEEKGQLFIKDDKINYNLPIIDDVDTLERIPEIDYNYNVDFSLSSLCDGLSTMGLIDSDGVKLFTENGKLMMCSIHDIRGATHTICDAPDTEHTVKIGKQFLKDVALSTPDIIRMYMKSDAPLSIEYEKDNLNFVVIIAPRVGE